MACDKKGIKKPMKSASSAAGGKLKVEGEEEVRKVRLSRQAKRRNEVPTQ